MNWYHAHVYFNSDDHSAGQAEEMRDSLQRNLKGIEYIGPLVKKIIGPHPLPQFEIHFKAEHLWTLTPRLYQERGELSVLVHPVSPNDHEDHFTRAIWLGEPFRLDATKLDPPGMNKAFLRLGKGQ